MAAGVGRGRASAQAVSIAGSEIFRLARPRPPAELGDDEAEEWRAIVGALPPDHFPRDTHPLLVDYCYLITRMRQIRSRIKQICDTEPLDDEAYLKWINYEMRESRVKADLATRMRLAQGTYEDRRLRKPETVEQPWSEDQG